VSHLPHDVAQIEDVDVVIDDDTLDVAVPSVGNARETRLEDQLRKTFKT